MSERSVESILDDMSTVGFTGAVRMATADGYAVIYFMEGRVYFASLNGEFPTGADFARHGVSAEMVASAARHRDAATRFAEALLDAGAAPSAVKAVAWERIRLTMSALLGRPAAHLAVGPHTHPFGALFTWPVDELASEGPAGAAVVSLSILPRHELEAARRDTYDTVASLRAAMMAR